MVMQAFTFPPGVGLSRYLIRYKGAGDTSDRVKYVPAVETSTTIIFNFNRIGLNASFNFTVAAQYRMQNCNAFILGARSLSVIATTRELGEEIISIQ